MHYELMHRIRETTYLLIGAWNWSEHNATLEAVLQKADDYGITLNNIKWVFGQPELEFYGYWFSQQGLTLPPDKVQAIKDYEAGKDEADPLDFLSRHPMPETGEDETEEMVKSITEAEPAIDLSKIKAETVPDNTLQKLSQIIHKGNWMEYRKDPDISSLGPSKRSYKKAKV